MTDGKDPLDQNWHPQGHANPARQEERQRQEAEVQEMSIVRKPAPGKSAQWAKWDDTNQKWLLGSQPDPSRFYFWLGAAAETL